MLLKTACDCISTYTVSSSTSHFAAVVEKPISCLLVVRANSLLQITCHHGWINLPGLVAKKGAYLTISFLPLSIHSRCTVIFKDPSNTVIEGFHARALENFNKLC